MNALPTSPAENLQRSGFKGQRPARVLVIVFLWGMALGSPGATAAPVAPTHDQAETVVVVTATGTGFPPPRYKGVQARMMARRAAEVIAVRNLARRLGMPHRARLRGFRYTKTEYHADNSVTVTAERRYRVRK